MMCRILNCHETLARKKEFIFARASAALAHVLTYRQQDAIWARATFSTFAGGTSPPRSAVLSHRRRRECRGPRPRKIRACQPEGALRSIPADVAARPSSSRAHRRSSSALSRLGSEGATTRAHSGTPATSRHWIARFGRPTSGMWLAACGRGTGHKRGRACCCQGRQRQPGQQLLLSDGEVQVCAAHLPGLDRCR